MGIGVGVLLVGVAVVVDGAVVGVDRGDGGEVEVEDFDESAARVSEISQGCQGLVSGLEYEKCLSELRLHML